MTTATDALKKSPRVERQSLLSILQLLLLLLMFPIFTLAVDPFGLREAGSPLAVNYVYVFWPKLLLVTCSAALALVTGLVLRLPLPPRSARLPLLSLLIFFLMLVGTRWLARDTLPTPDQLWVGAVDRADGLLWQGLWMALLPLFAWVMPPLFNHPASLRRLHILWGAAIIGTFLWISLQTMGIQPTKWIYPNFQSFMPAAGLGHQAQTGFIASLAWVATTILLVERRVGPFGYLCLVCAAASTALSLGRSGVVTGCLGIVIYGVMLLQKNLRIDFLRQYILAVTIGLLAIGLSFQFSNNLSRAATLSKAISGQDASFNHRLLLWKAGMRVVLEHPLLGESRMSANDMIWTHLDSNDTRELLTEYGDPDSIRSGHYTFKNNILSIKNENSKEINLQLVNWDKFHNLYLEIATQSGVLTLSFYIVFLTSLGAFLWKSMSIYGRMGAVLLIMFAAYSLVWFSTPTADPIIFSLLGLCTAAAVSSSRKQTSLEESGN